MKNDFQQDGILYYPTIEIQDETFLKVALLFWDKVFRIVPESVTPNDSFEVKLAVEANLLENINLNSQDLVKTAEKFTVYCEKLHSIPAAFTNRNFEIKIHPEKIDEKLRVYFRQIAYNIDRQGYYHVDETIGSGYMFYLADTISQRRNIAKLTEDIDVFAGMTFFDGGAGFGEEMITDTSLDAYSNLVIESLIPADIRSLSIDKIIKLNEKYKVEKTRFRNLISNFIGKLSKIEDSEFAKKEIESFKKSLIENQATKYEVLRSFIGELKFSLFYVGFPTLISNILGNLISPHEDFYSFNKICQGASIAGVASIVQAGRETRREWKSSTSNYYIDLLKDLDSKDPVNLKYRNVRGRLNEFVND